MNTDDDIQIYNTNVLKTSFMNLFDTKSLASDKA